MKKLILLMLVAATVACSKPDPYDKVRELRRKYELTMDLTVNDQGTASYEIKARNLSGSSDLHEITCFVKIMDKDKKVLWQKKVEVDVSGVGNYASASQTGQDEIGDLGEWEYYDIVLAPDLEGEEFLNYREFMRVGK